MATGWAYVNCTASGGGGALAGGPTGSIQFHTSGSAGQNQLSGSRKLMYYTASYPPGGGAYHQFSTLVLTGTLKVKGAITASAYRIVDTDVISGSTTFGNSADDIHLRTGSLNVVSGAVGAAWNTGHEAILSASALNRRVYVRSLTGRYQAVATNVTVSMALNSDNQALIYGFTAAAGSGQTILRLLAPAQAGAGTMVVVKDQVSGRPVGDKLIISGSGGGDTIDGSSYFQLTGNMPAINLFSDGSNWFIF